MTCRLTKRLGRFARDTHGNIAMLTAISIIPLLAAGALAVDYTYAETMKTKVSAAADAAALSAAQLYSSTEAQRVQRAQQVFNAAISSLPGVSGVTLNAVDVKTGTVYTGFRVEVSAQVETVLGKVIGQNGFNIGARAEASLGDGGKLEIALVLDTTGSMDGPKLAALKTSATALVDDLSAKALTPQQIKFALTPFAQYVNVGMANRNQSWISVPPDSSQNVCWMSSPVTGKSNCRMQTQTWYNDGIPVSYQAEVCDYTYGPAVQVCGQQVIQWQGCAGSRNYPLNVQDGNYGTPVPGLRNDMAWCPGEMQPLTTSTSAIKNGIAAMSAAGETYIPAGLSWGWRALSPGGPFDESDKGKTSTKVHQYLILMTDGANTISPTYPAHYGSDTAVANQLTSELCAAIKADQITVFTIAFDVTDVTIKNILQSCASKSDSFFDATNAAQLASAFSQIGNAITALRLKK